MDLYLLFSSSSVNIPISLSMRVASDFIPNRSRPGITTTVTSDRAPRATGGHATWMQRRGRKERNKERKKANKIKLKVATLNVGTMTGKEEKWGP